MNLAAALAAFEQSVLVIDLDPQANCSSGLGWEGDGPTSYEVLEGLVALRSAVPTWPGRHAADSRLR